MKSLFAVFLALVLLTRWAPAQTPPVPDPSATTNAAPATASRPPAPASEMQSTIDQLRQSNRDLLDLLKKQQGVLEDIQFDRRLQSRQIASLELRLDETLQDNARLQRQVAKLEATAAAPPAPANTTVVSTNAPPDKPALVDAPPPPPSTYLPAPESEGAPGTKSWHRLFTLSGQDGKNSDIFHVQGRQWRVLWHNQDKPGKAYQNTSALFISAFPKDDTIPQKVCSKLGSGGDSTELIGPGNYYLKIEASGGAWELAVEDFR